MQARMPGYNLYRATASAHSAAQNRRRVQASQAAHLSLAAPTSAACWPCACMLSLLHTCPHALLQPLPSHCFTAWHRTSFEGQLQRGCALEPGSFRLGSLLPPDQGICAAAAAPTVAAAAAAAVAAAASSFLGCLLLALGLGGGRWLVWSWGACGSGRVLRPVAAALPGSGRGGSPPRAAAAALAAQG